MTPAALDEGFGEAAVADLPALLALRRRVIGDADLTWDDRAYLAWRFGLDPERPGAPPGSRLFVLRRGGEILGTIGVEEVVFDGPTGSVLAWRLLDLMVEPAINGVGLGAWLNLAVFERNPVAIAMGASDQAIGLVNRMFRRLPDRPTWVAALDASPLISRAPGLGRVPGLATAGSFGLSMYRKLRARGGASNLELVPIESAAALGDRVERLGASMAASGLFVARRTAEKLAWRFLANPRRDYRILIAEHRGRAAAALVTRRRSADSGDIADLVWDATLPGDERDRVLTTAIARVLDGFAAEGAVKARVMAYDAVTGGVLKRLGFVRRPERAPFAIRAADPAQTDALAAAKWFITYGDSDGD